MENQKSQTCVRSYQQHLNNLLCAPTFRRLSEFFQLYPNSTQILFNCDGSFIGRVERDLIVAKRKILQHLFQLYKHIKPTELKSLSTKIRGLTYSVHRVLREGIIGIYSDLSSLAEDSGIGETKSQFYCLLKSIMAILEPLLRDYFILSQMEKADNILAIGSLQAILSQKNINSPPDSLLSINSAHSIKELLSDRVLKEITRSIELKSIQQLINEDLKQSQTSEIEETCRICNISFKVRVLQKHVRSCSRIQAENSRRQEITENQLLIVQKLREQLVQNISTLTEEQLKIYNSIIAEFQETPNQVKRRSSYYQSKRRQKLLKRLQAEIEAHLSTGSSNELLSSFYQLTRERELIERKIITSKLAGNNENVIFKKCEDSCLDKIKSSQNCRTTKLVSIKTKKSLFARKEESCSSQDNSRTDEFASEIKKFQSIKANLEDVFDSSESELEQKKGNLHKSLCYFAKADEETRREICIDDFAVLKFIGKGAFGKVYLVRRKRTQDIYALKVIKIQQNWDQKQLASIRNEHQILSQIAGQHLVKAPFSFTEGSAHFFVLQYMPGGDLARVIEEQVYLDFNQSQFYLAEIVLAIERLHEMGIIHRDLKPENLIFDQSGHLKLTDFGLSEIRINDKIRKVKKLGASKSGEIEPEVRVEVGETKLGQKMKSTLVQKRGVKIIGTPDYIAPEIISGECLDNLSIDWWSLGVIAYQMMIGCRPFCANTVDEVIRNIEQLNIQWPSIGDQDDEISPVAADLIKKLLNPNYSQRLGSKSVDQIKLHPFFEGVDWSRIRSMKPPLIPTIDGKQNYEYAQELPELKYEIKGAIGNCQIKSSFKLDNFVRYDILVEETLSSAGKRIVQRSSKIKKLKSIASNFGSSNGESKEPDGHFADTDLDEECWSNFRND